MVRYFIVSHAKAKAEVVDGPFFTMEAAQERLRTQFLGASGYTSCAVLEVQDAEADFSDITRLARIEAIIAEHGLRPETAADLWIARKAAAHAQARLGLSNAASGA
jgi:hypothetical protein